MSDTAKATNVLEACSVDGRLETLTELSEQLETCQKSLSEYLDTKRCAFPRFFFISDGANRSRSWTTCKPCRLSV